MKSFQLIISFSIIYGCFEKTSELKYTPYTSSFIEVTIETLSSDSLFIGASAFTNIPDRKINAEPLSINTPGSYYLQLEIDRPLASTFTVGNQSYQVFLTPGDTSKIIVMEAQEVDLSFEGTNQLINGYYLSKKKALSYKNLLAPLNTTLTSEKKFNIIKLEIDSMVAVEKAFVQRYATRNLLPKWFVDYELFEIVYRGANFKTGLPMYNKLFSIFNDSLPPDYYDYLNEISINNPSAIYASAYLDFLNSYFLLDAPQEYESLSGFYRNSAFKSYRLTKSKKALSQEVKDVYHLSEFMDMLRFYSDDLDIDSTANAFELSNYQSVVRAYQTEVASVSMLTQDEIVPDFYLEDPSDSLISIRAFQDKIIYINFWAPWCKPCIKNIPALNAMIHSFERTDSIICLNIGIDIGKEEWLGTTIKHEIAGFNLYADRKKSRYLRSIFGVRGIPHYLILDKHNVLKVNHANKAPGVRDQLVGLARN